MKGIACTMIIMLFTLCPAVAQTKITTDDGVKFIVGASDHEGKKIPHIILPTYYAYAPLIFKNQKEQRYYGRLVRDVKKTIPLAAEIRDIIYDTQEQLKLLPNDKARKKFLDKKEKELKEAYTPKMKKLTFRQGKLLIKLIDRECDQSAYQLIKLFMGSFKAVFYQSFAKLFGASLKKTYDPTGEDFMIERVVVLVLNGQL
ncbi:MAG: DUF4294 domain-containing protein [Bacteroidaceae bacterium]|nr:DUF4294 domain-containing protein [Bacteroidaceae bacterium]